MTARTIGAVLFLAAAFVGCGNDNKGSGNVVPTSFKLSVQKSGTGSGSVVGGPIDCGATCSATIATGTVVSLTATPDATSTFAGFTGCDSASGTSCAVTMNADRTVAVTFSGGGACSIGQTRQCSENASGNTIAWPTGKPLGTCSYGTQSCASSGGVGAWGACIGAVAPAARDCTTSLDNNCDGAPDNARDDVCQCSAGETRACTGNPAYPGSTCPGTQSCQASASSAIWGACNGPQACECTTDQACTAGACQGSRPCVNGQLGACEHGGTPLPASCQCLPGATQGCQGVNGCGTATCSGSFTWDTSACHTQTQYCADDDLDGHGNPNKTILACGQPAGYVESCDDCAPNEHGVYAGATCGYAENQGDFECVAGTFDATCVCQGAHCAHTFLPLLPGVGDTSACPPGYTAAACVCTPVTPDTVCIAAPNPDQSCHYVVQCIGPACAYGLLYQLCTFQ